MRLIESTLEQRNKAGEIATRILINRHADEFDAIFCKQLKNIKLNANCNTDEMEDNNGKNR